MTIQITLSDETANLVKAEALRLSEGLLKYYSESDVVEWIVSSYLGNPDEADKRFFAGVDSHAVRLKMDAEIAAWRLARRLTDSEPSPIEQRILQEERKTFHETDL